MQSPKKTGGVITPLSLCRTMASMSLVTFGGGYVILSTMKRYFVTEKGALTAETLDQLTAVAQSAPGPIAVNAAFLVGWQLAGFRGGVASVVGAVLPPLVLLSALAVGYSYIRSILWIRAMLPVLEAAIAAIICNVALDMLQKAIRARDRFSLFLTALCLGLLLCCPVNAAFLLIGGALLGMLMKTRVWAKSNPTKGGL